MLFGRYWVDTVYCCAARGWPYGITELLISRCPFQPVKVSGRDQVRAAGAGDPLLCNVGGNAGHCCAACVFVGPMLL